MNVSPDGGQQDGAGAAQGYVQMPAAWVIPWAVANGGG